MQIDDVTFEYATLLIQNREREQHKVRLSGLDLN
uniref:Uncharacterized protein n=1 Tax=Parascaris univalens TaxID=6257 RepID=A0A914ZRH8_PARUN